MADLPPPLGPPPDAAHPPPPDLTGQPPPPGVPPTLVVIFVAVALLFGGLIGAVVGANISNDSQQLGTIGTGATTTSVGDDGGSSSDDGGGVTTSTAAASEQAPLTIDHGFGTSVDSIGVRHVSAGALVTNPNKTLASYDVQVLFNLKDAGGKVLDSESATVPYIPAASTVPVAPLQIGFDLKGEPTTLEVIATGEFREDQGWSGVDFLMGKGIDLTVTTPAVTLGSYSSSLTAQVTNPSTQLAEYGTWTCVLKKSSEIVGGETSGISDRIPAGATVAIDQSLSVPASPDEIICRAYA